MKMAKLQDMKPTIRFSATLSRTGITLLKSASLKLPRNKTIVEGMINYLPFRGALVPKGGSYALKVSNAMRKAVGLKIGDTTTIEITRVGDEQEVRVPMDLLEVLKITPRSLTSWSDITPMARRDWIFSICSSKQTETRARRIDKAVDMLRSGKRRLCCFPGIKWMMKENAKTCGMWQRLGK
jgi:hypothetical protein